MDSVNCGPKKNLKVMTQSQFNDHISDLIGKSAVLEYDRVNRYHVAENYSCLLNNADISVKDRKFVTDRLTLLQAADVEESPPGLIHFIEVDETYLRVDALWNGAHRNMSASLKQIQADIHFELAIEYINANENKHLERGHFTLNDRNCPVYREYSPEFNEAMFLQHLIYASKLGLAKASLILALLYTTEKTLFLPSRKGLLVWKDDEEVALALTSERSKQASKWAKQAEQQALDQKDKVTMFKLCEHYVQIGRYDDAQRCCDQAVELGYVLKQEYVVPKSGCSIQ
jgi:hypothetical protein